MSGWNGWAIAAVVCFVAVLVWLSIIDARTQRLPRRLIYAGAAVCAPLLLIATLVADQPRRIGWMVGCAAGAVVALLLMYFVSRGGLGDGDVRLGGLIGLVLGYFSWRLVVGGLTLGFMLGAIGGIVAVATRRATMRSPIPFGPFLAAGALLALAGSKWLQ